MSPANPTHQHVEGAYGRVCVDLGQEGRVAHHRDTARDVELALQHVGLAVRAGQQDEVAGPVLYEWMDS